MTGVAAGLPAAASRPEPGWKSWQRAQRDTALQVLNRRLGRDVQGKVLGKN